MLLKKAALMKRILIIGGNRFFGLHLAEQLLSEGHQVTLLNRGNTSDSLGGRVQRLIADRTSESSLLTALANAQWDIVFDQVCYTAEEARLACRIFQNRCHRYIVTSTESVFDDGENQTESGFDPYKFRFQEDVPVKTSYQTAKRQMEAIFAQEKNFAVALPRPSLVVGVDDYTRRLKWHLDRVNRGEPMYFPNLGIASDFIRSDQAGTALKLIGFSHITGPVNLTTPGAITMRELLTIAEDLTGRKAILSGDEAHHSPYGGSATKTMNTALLRSLGFNAPASSSWMHELCSELLGI
jgi:nucleoside-diphosphate-sugar epimerase